MSVPVQLDTSFLIRALVPNTKEDRKLREWLSRGEPIGISPIAWAEFLCGPLTGDDRATARAIVGPPTGFDERAAELAAAMFNIAGRRRRTFVDCLVAASAVRAGARLATSNASDFAALKSAGLDLAQ